MSLVDLDYSDKNLSEVAKTLKSFTLSGFL